MLALRIGIGVEDHCRIPSPSELCTENLLRAALEQEVLNRFFRSRTFFLQKLHSSPVSSQRPKAELCLGSSPPTSPEKKLPLRTRRVLEWRDVCCLRK